jgi:hypothetical protein
MCLDATLAAATVHAGDIPPGGGGEAVKRTPERRTIPCERGSHYERQRIHLSRLQSELWLGMIVQLGEWKPMTKDPLTPAVTRMPGEYHSRAEALHVAMQYVDHLDGGG